MISLVGFVLILGLIVFGPKKTIEIAQDLGRMLARAKQATGQLENSVMEPNQRSVPVDSSSHVGPVASTDSRPL